MRRNSRKVESMLDEFLDRHAEEVISKATLEGFLDALNIGIGRK